MRPDGLAESCFIGPLAQIYGLQRVAAVIRGFPGGPSVAKGKAVVVMCAAGWNIDKMRTYGSRWDILQNQFLFVMKQLERLGVTVVIAAGNGGSTASPEQPNEQPNFVPEYLDQAFPQAWVTENESPVLVGATNNKGQLSSWTTPGRGADVVSLYAQGASVKSTDLLSSEPDFRSGTSYSAPIVVRTLKLEPIPLLLPRHESLLLTYPGWPRCLHPRPSLQLGPVPVQSLACS